MHVPLETGGCAAALLRQGAGAGPALSTFSLLCGLLGCAGHAEMGAWGKVRLADLLQLMSVSLGQYLVSWSLKQAPEQLLGQGRGGGAVTCTSVLGIIPEPGLKAQGDCCCCWWGE